MIKQSSAGAYEIAVHMAIELNLHRYMTRDEVSNWIKRTKEKLMKP